MTDQPTKRPAIHTVSQVFPDGSIAELTRHEEATRFVVWSDGRSDVRDTIELRDGSIGIPYSPRNNLLAHGVVLLPSQPEEYESTTELHRDVRAFIHRYVDVSENFEEIASYYVLLSWVYDAFNELPYLRFRGDYGSGKSRCLQVIGSVCYKPIFASGASTVSPLFRIMDIFRGTLVIDEGDFRFSDAKAEIVKILNNGNAAGFPVLRSEATPTKEFNPRAFTVFGPKLIATRRPFDDPALESRCITETMSGLPPRRDIPLSLPSTFRDEARRLRNKLLLYRFRNLGSVAGPAPDWNRELEPRIAQVYAPLVAIVDDRDAQARLLASAGKASSSLRSERGDSVEARLLDIILELRRERIALSVKEIAKRFGARFGDEFRRPPTPRWIGAQLRRRLFLATVKSHGNFVVPATEMTRVEALAARFGLDSLPMDVGTSGMSAGDGTKLTAVL